MAVFSDCKKSNEGGERKNLIENTLGPAYGLVKEIKEMPVDARFEIALSALLIVGAALRYILADVSVAELVLYIALAGGLVGGYLAGLARGRERALKQRGKCPHCGTRILLLLFHLNEKQESLF